MFAKLTINDIIELSHFGRVLYKDKNNRYIMADIGKKMQVGYIQSGSTTLIPVQISDTDDEILSIQRGGRRVGD